MGKYLNCHTLDWYFMVIVKKSGTNLPDNPRFFRSPYSERWIAQLSTRSFSPKSFLKGEIIFLLLKPGVRWSLSNLYHHSIRTDCLSGFVFHFTEQQVIAIVSSPIDILRRSALLSDIEVMIVKTAL